MILDLHMNFEVYIVFDDRCSKPGFLEGFGFSALVYNHLTKNYILFDTGDNGKKLLKNILQSTYSKQVYLRSHA